MLELDERGRQSSEEEPDRSQSSDKGSRSSTSASAQTNPRLDLDSIPTRAQLAFPQDTLHSTFTVQLPATIFPPWPTPVQFLLPTATRQHRSTMLPLSRPPRRMAPPMAAWTLR